MSGPFIHLTDYPSLMARDAPSSSDPDKPSGSGRPSSPRRVQLSDAMAAQSRETGDVPPNVTLSFAKSWNHFIAGGIGGTTAAALTAPLDVLKTRLQSGVYQKELSAAHRLAAAKTTNPLRAISFHLRETMQILSSVRRTEGTRALFKGLGPNLIGVTPARSINFYCYGNGKRLIADHFNKGEETAFVHLSAGAVAGIIASTATNPIWLVKTRLQLDKNLAQSSGGLKPRQYRNSWDCVKQTVHKEGIKGLYKGMSASYLGVAESSIQWTLYEQFKKSLRKREERILASGRPRTAWDTWIDWSGKMGAAASSKLIAAVWAYPHEVARTRLREIPLDGSPPKYTGVFQCLRLVYREERLMGLFGGLTPHLLRTVPSAAIMFTMYEGILYLLGTKA